MEGPPSLNLEKVRIRVSAPTVTRWAAGVGVNMTVLHSKSHKTCRWGGELDEQSDQYCSNHHPANYHGLIGTLWKTTEGINDERMQTTQEPRQAWNKRNSPSPEGDFTWMYDKIYYKCPVALRTFNCSGKFQFCVIYIGYKYIWWLSAQRHGCAFWGVSNLQLHSYALHH